jgi:hypothetical protein
MVDTIAPTVQHLTEQQCRALDADFDSIVNGLAAAHTAAAIVSLDRAADLLDQIGTRIAGLAYGLRHASTELTTTRSPSMPMSAREHRGVVVPASLAGPERPGEAG